MKRRVSACLLAVLLLCSLLPALAASPERHSTTVLFTHDLHSHFLPQSDGQGNESGGYARLKTALDRERRAHPDALTVDGGDFSIGSLIQTLYTTQGAELRTMGAMGYDAAAVGNHEFDHTGTGFADMLNAVVESGDPAPALLMANYKPAASNPDQLDILRSMAAYGVQDYMLLERGGVTYGLFGLMGVDSDACAPSSGFELGDMVSEAQRCVDALKAEGAQFIICLSHSGTNEKKKLSEDERLAEEHRPDYLRPHPHHPGPAHPGGGHLYRLRRALLRKSGLHHHRMDRGRGQDPVRLPLDAHRPDPAQRPDNHYHGGALEGTGRGDLLGPLRPDL